MLILFTLAWSKITDEQESLTGIQSMNQLSQNKQRIFLKETIYISCYQQIYYEAN